MGLFFRRAYRRQRYPLRCFDCVRREPGAFAGVRARLLAGTALAVLTTLPAAAQDATWLANPGSGDFNTAANWNPSVPTGTAFFGASTITSLSFSADATVGGWTFNSNAPVYNFSNNQIVTFTGAGMVFNGGGATITSIGSIAFENNSTAGRASFSNDTTGTINFFQNSTAGSATFSSTNFIGFRDASTAGSATITNTFGILNFTESSTAGNATITNNSGGFVIFIHSTTAGNATITNNVGGDVSFRVNATAGNATITNNAGGTLLFEHDSTAGNATLINSGTASFINNSSGGNARLIANAGGAFDISGLATSGTTAGSIEGVGTYLLGSKQLTVGGNGLSTTLSGLISDGGTSGGTGGSLVKAGGGTLTLSGNNTYSGGTAINGGLIAFNSASNFGTGNITLNGGGLQWASGSTADISSRLTALGTGGGTFDTNGNNVTLASAISGAGGLTKQGSGLLNLTGTNTYAGPTSVTAGTLAVNGSITSNVTVGAAGTLGGTGVVFGAVNTLGTLAPGNSIGTLNVTGSFTQAAGSIYQVEVNPAGQGDRINVTGAPGTATINGGTVQVLATPGNYGASTTYTILTATGGRTGTYAGVTSNYAFLSPSLSYDTNNVFLTLALLDTGGTGFLMSAYTPNQKAVGNALNQSFAGASGDYATVIGALTSLTAFQGPAALNALSGEQYADFGTMNVNNSAMFMNTIGQQMALARSGAAAAGQRAALAQACDIAACDGASPLTVWGSALGGLGAVAGDYNASTATYNYAGAAMGIDYRLDPRFLVGLGVGYTAGNLWVNSFAGRGWTNNVSVAAYGSFTQGGFYADLLGGYAYYNNQLQRQIQIPGLQRTASGSIGANQALGQVETGYRFGVYAPAAATLAPFARLQGSSVTQNAFTESGAQSLNLNVSQQTTNSLRTLFGLDLAGSVPLGTDRTLDLGLRLGWQHEFASTMRPITAALAGAPFAAFTIYGATPQPDSAVVSLRAATEIAAATQLYLRYDGDIGSGSDNHAINFGLRISW